MTNHCGECNACCKVYAIPEVKKPAGPWCTHCAIGVGCKIYEERPERCRDFQCLWLQTQGSPDPLDRMDPALRPDRCKVVFAPTTNPMIVTATPMRPGAQHHPLVTRLIELIARKGGGVAVHYPTAMTSTLITADGEKEVEMTEPDEDGMQWSKNNG